MTLRVPVTRHACVHACPSTTSLGNPPRGADEVQHNTAYLFESLAPTASHDTPHSHSLVVTCRHYHLSTRTELR
jgi:hypothetical protein